MARFRLEYRDFFKETKPLLSDKATPLIIDARYTKELELCCVINIDKYRRSLPPKRKAKQLTLHCDKCNKDIYLLRSGLWLTANGGLSPAEVKLLTLIHFQTRYCISEVVLEIDRKWIPIAISLHKKRLVSILELEYEYDIDDEIPDDAIDPDAKYLMLKSLLY